MILQFKLLPIVVVFLLCAHLIPATAEAQDAASAAASARTAEASQADTQEEEKGLWDGILSTIVDFFVDDSPDSESDESPDSESGEGTNIADGQDAQSQAAIEEAQKTALAVSGAGVASNQLHRRRSLRHSHLGDDDITASHVYQVTADLISEIEILRNRMKIVDGPNKTAFHPYQSPIHVYAKSLEVMQKTARIQKRLGMIPVEVGQIPVKSLTQFDLYNAVKTIIKELRRIKRQLIVKDDIALSPFVGGKAPSHVYENLLHASLLLDGLVGRSATANDVYGQVLRIQNEMNLVASELGVSLDVDPPTVEHAKQPMAVAQQLFRAAYKLVDVQTKLGMDASNVPNFTLENVTSSDALDATNFLLAEIARIKAHLNIQLAARGSHDPRDMTATDVFARILLVIRNLDIIGEAAKRAG